MACYNAVYVSDCLKDCLFYYLILDKDSFYVPDVAYNNILENDQEMIKRGRYG